jgi:SAM-dependent methyltransferase
VSTPTDLIEFVLSQLPPARARVLEVGCGAGELARALAGAGHDVLAIDPLAPEGPLFRRTTLEALDDPGPFGAVVASRSLHHVHDLDDALERIATLAPLLVLDEFTWDRLDEATARFYEEQRLLREADVPPVSMWDERHSHLHGFDALTGALGRRFDERSFTPWPYLYRYFHRPELEALEREQIEAGRIQALGFRYVGAAFTRHMTPMAHPVGGPDGRAGGGRTS